VRGRKVKTLVQDDVQAENVTFFTARSHAVSWANSSGTALDGPMGEDSVSYDADYRMDGTPWFRVIHGKKTLTSSAGLTRLATWEEENSEDAAAIDGSGLHAGRPRAILPTVVGA
jgi:hypothetical protein